MENFTISDPVVYAAAMIAILLGRANLNIPIGSKKIKQFLDDIFASERCFRQRSSTIFVVPSLDDISAVLNNKHMRFGLSKVFESNIQFNQAYIDKRHTYEILFIPSYDASIFIGLNRDLITDINVMYTKLHGVLKNIKSSSVASSNSTRSELPTCSSTSSTFSASSVNLFPIVRPTCSLSILADAADLADILPTVSPSVVTSTPCSNISTRSASPSCSPTAFRTALTTTFTTQSPLSPFILPLTKKVGRPKLTVNVEELQQMHQDHLDNINHLILPWSRS
jgi:hypothetical protein